eukprot:s701_g7.t1
MKQYIAARLMSNFLIELRFADSCASFERWPFAPVSATSKEAEWVSSPRSAPPEARGNQGNQGSVAVNAARKVMSISEDLHIQEDYSEDNELEEAIERIRASEPYTRRAARCGRTAPQVSAPRMATSEFDSASARDGGLGGAKQAPQPASSTSSFDDIQARTAALSSRIRPRSAEQRSYAAGSQSSRPSSARSARSRANWSVQSTPARSVVGNIRCDQLISRHLPEREARSRMISVLARQLERLRDHIPAFAQQWQTVEAFISLCQQRVADKAKEGFLSVPRRQQLLVAAALLAPQAAMAREGFTETSSGLQYKVVQEGTGPIPTTGQRIKADYTGWLDDFESDRKFDSSRDRRQPLEFQVGIGKVIKGWDESLLSMKVGERRQIIVPPVLGYGNRGIGPIPPGSTLYFDVELKSIEQQEQPWKPVVLVLVFWALSAANVYFCWCYPGSSLLASASHISSLLMCVLLSFILAVPTIPKSRKPFMQAIWYTILGGMLPAAVSVSLLQWRHGELPEPMLDYFETPSSYSLRGADTVGTWGLQPLAQAGIVSWAPVAYLQSTILWIVTLYNLTHVVGSVDASVQQDLPLSLQVIYYVIVALWLSSLIRVLCTRPGQPKDFQGFGNYKYFVMFITYSAVALLFKAVTLLLFSIKAFQNEITFCTKLWLVCTEILVIALGGTMVAFSGFHLFLSSKGMTTIEFLTRHEKSEKKISFDQGVLGNLQASLGRIPLFWLLPACPPSGDGRNFPYTVIPQELEPNKDQSAESRSLALAAPQTKSSLKENLNQRNSKLSDIRAPSQPCLQSTAEPTCLEQQQDGCVAADGFGEDRVEALEEEIRVLQKLHARQYDLLDQGLQRQVEEAKSAWKARRRHVEACKQEEYELHSKVVSQEQRTKALKTTLEKTWRQMEDMQQSVSRSRAVLEARANGDWSADLDESTMCGKSRQMAEEMQRHMEVRQELNSQRNQVQAATEVLGQQRVDLACSESAQIALGAFCCDSLDRCNMLQLVFI